MAVEIDAYLAELRSAGDPVRSEGMAGYHKIPRVYLGLSNPQVDALTKSWRKQISVDERVTLARGLWDTDIYEARLAAAKLFTQARIRPDAGVWDAIQDWVPDFDSWALADHVCMAGQKRLVADPERLNIVESWTQSPKMWTRRAALVITLPWTKQNNPKAAELEARDRILGWAQAYVPERDWFIQKAIAWWVRELSKHDIPRATAFLERNGAAMKPFARKEAGKYLRA